MANLNSAAKCICPFYQSEGEKSISCEGLIRGTRVQTRFGDAEKKKRHQERACCTGEYTRYCYVAAALMARYRKG